MLECGHEEFENACGGNYQDFEKEISGFKDRAGLWQSFSTCGGGDSFGTVYGRESEYGHAGFI